ncbi:cytochrome-c oxidase, cbb3-type subunit III [Lysobacter pythonis]|uniref:Cbb3-type cytochrome c oxidase subunit n=1 Tax=Solilutibacter pythonis TaxID=2483112 RepID=A0A3M2I6E0_9GAMM|nr:cytochrome-c oxidase, cbb3-type subunit III [Lysobacter pythonis]RMH93844.1 cytochrome-c oxidase, cbb3-type subunit III [Lysobacter pythonis]
MSDWTSSLTSGWSLWIIALVIINVFGCIWLLVSNSKRRPGDPAPDETSHVWDGDLTEYNKPMPKWWINLFWITIVFAAGYLVYYPGFGAFAGTSKWTSADEMKKEQVVENKKLEAAFAPFAGKPVDVLASDPAAVKIGRGIFNNTCAVCHGSTAQGAVGYPNLTDSIWHWGGTPQDVLTSIQQGRQGVMAPWGDVLKGTGGEQAVEQVIAYVRTLSQPNASLQNDFLASQGKKLYDGVCVACHGPDGKGNAMLGAPDLTDNYWLYGSSTESLRETISNGRHGVMPAHLELLGDTRTRLVGAYVWSLSHGGGNMAAKPANASAR